jgi:hypothetical protein
MQGLANFFCKGPVYSSALSTVNRTNTQLQEGICQIGSCDQRLGSPRWPSAGWEAREPDSCSVQKAGASEPVGQGCSPRLRLKTGKPHSESLVWVHVQGLKKLESDAHSDGSKNHTYSRRTELVYGASFPLPLFVPSSPLAYWVVPSKFRVLPPPHIPFSYLHVICGNALTDTPMSALYPSSSHLSIQSNP